MREESHKTIIGTLMHHVNIWRRRESISRETIAQIIVEHHEKLNGPADTGIRFDPPTKDHFSVVKVNADRIFRWLDDSTKDNNLLPANFMLAVIGALPMDLRIRAMSDLLGRVGLQVDVLFTGASGTDFSKTLSRLCKEAGEAHSAVADLTDGTTKEELLKAERELVDAAASTEGALEQVRSALKK